MPITDDPESQPPAGEPDPFENLVLDEEFIKGARVKEPAGRTRILAARWRNRPPEPQPAWRPPTEPKKRFGKRPVKRDAWGDPILRPKRNRWQAPVYVVLAIVVVAAGLNISGLHGWYLSHFGDKGSASLVGASPAPTRPVPTEAPETAQPTAAPPTQAPQTPTVAQPWLGSPAEAWPAGPDAIVAPPAQATGVFSQHEVAAQLQTVKDFLVSSNIDPAVVAGATPQHALDLLDSQSRAEVEAALAHPSHDHDPTSYVSRFNPRTAVPAGNVVKVQGRMTFEGDGHRGVVVHTDYDFVYALVPGPTTFDPSGVPSASPTQGGGNGQSVSFLSLDPKAEVTREIVRRTQDFRFYDPSAYTVETGKLSFGPGSSNMGNNYCEGGDGWLEPVFPDTNGGDDGPHNGATVDPYDLSKPVPDDGKCGTSSRS
ncbi:hypothetical protein [Kitasatospora sp. LaBMicrA B282]|uniref:SCO2583/SCO2584 N-terminal domain-containing protein n=1 Tax=Kitasatospora sp. LaBMicrA B282 TaxID=3420949 RepID=UPI003D12203B